MDGLIKDIANDTEVLMGGYDYPVINTANLNLPIIYRYNKWVSLSIAVAIFIFFAFILTKAIQVLQVFLFHSNDYSYLIILLALLGILIASGIGSWQYFIRFLEPTYLIITEDYIEIRVNNFKKNRQVIPYANLFQVYTWYSGGYHSRGYYVTILDYVITSADGLSYKKKSVSFYLQQVRNLSKSLEMTATIKILMESYHKKHGLADKLPRLINIRQK